MAAMSLDGLMRCTSCTFMIYRGKRELVKAVLGTG